MPGYGGYRHRQLISGEGNGRPYIFHFRIITQFIIKRGICRHSAINGERHTVSCYDGCGALQFYDATADSRVYHAILYGDGFDSDIANIICQGIGVFSTLSSGSTAIGGVVNGGTLCS